MSAAVAKLATIPLNPTVRMSAQHRGVIIYKHWSLGHA
jgi:hypothetical protein